MTVLSGIITIMAVIGGAYLIIDGLVFLGIFLLGVAVVIANFLLHMIDTNTQIKKLTERVEKLEEKLSEKEK